MTPRLDLMRTQTPSLKSLFDFSQAVAASGLEKSLLELVKIRASQINGCAYCLNMHTRDARANGESEQRIYLLAGWREAPCYSERERAALGWTEALTHVSQTRAPDEDYNALNAQFSAEEQVNLTLAIANINAWNRLCVGFRVVPEVDARHASH